jgi:hypothetical protein
LPFFKKKLDFDYLNGMSSCLLREKSEFFFAQKVRFTIGYVSQSLISPLDTTSVEIKKGHWALLSLRAKF